MVNWGLQALPGQSGASMMPIQQATPYNIYRSPSQQSSGSMSGETIALYSLLGVGGATLLSLGGYALHRHYRKEKQGLSNDLSRATVDTAKGGETKNTAAYADNSGIEDGVKKVDSAVSGSTTIGEQEQSKEKLELDPEIIRQQEMKYRLLINDVKRLQQAHQGNPSSNPIHVQRLERAGSQADFLKECLSIGLILEHNLEDAMRLSIWMEQIGKRKFMMSKHEIPRITLFEPLEFKNKSFGEQKKLILGILQKSASKPWTKRLWYERFLKETVHPQVHNSIMREVVKMGIHIP